MATGLPKAWHMPYQIVTQQTLNIQALARVLTLCLCSNVLWHLCPP